MPKAFYKNYNAVMEEQEKIPGWLTTGITYEYLLPKLGDNKEVRNYQPIACTKP